MVKLRSIVLLGWYLDLRSHETKILGILWVRQSDSFIIGIPNFSKHLSKRNLLQTLASIYDPLRFISPCLLTGKVIYRNICDLKIPCGKEIPKGN